LQNNGILILGDFKVGLITRWPGRVAGRVPGRILGKLPDPLPGFPLPDYPPTRNLFKATIWEEKFVKTSQKICSVSWLVLYLGFLGEGSNLTSENHLINSFFLN
jgi:hypothetical protein